MVGKVLDIDAKGLLRNVLSQCMLCDRLDLINRISDASKIRQKTLRNKVLNKIALDISLSNIKAERRTGINLTINYPAILPVSQKKNDIAKAIKSNQVVIISGEPGSGKTTQLPKIFLELGYGKFGSIAHTQPRRIAAQSVAKRISEEMGTKLGEAVGYKVRFSEKISQYTLVKLMTDGMFLAEIQHDRFLNQYDAVIIDEAHERSLNIDFILGYLKKLILTRSELRIIVTSATIDVERFSAYFSNAPIIEVSGSTYPVEIEYRPLCTNNNVENKQLESICEIVEEICNSQKKGDILIFLSGEREIHDTANALARRNLDNIKILSLYARLSINEQSNVFRLYQCRRIVLATNIAETSLTVPGIKYVIDPGTARVRRYSYRRKIHRLHVELISQSSANQRKGRCGRIENGICIRLYSEENFKLRSKFNTPEILRSSLASVILRMVALDLGNIQEFPFIELPDKRNIRDGIQLLEELGAIKSKNSSNKWNNSNVEILLTSVGHQLLKLPIELRLARIMLEAAKNACLKEVMIIVSALSTQDPREYPLDQKKLSEVKHSRFLHKDSDFLVFINLWKYIQKQKKLLTNTQFRQQCKQNFINYSLVQEWQNIYLKLQQIMIKLNFKLNDEVSSYSNIHRSILVGFLSYIGIRDRSKNEYQGVRKIRFSIFPASSIFKRQPKWVVSAELFETSKLWGRIVAKIQPKWIIEIAKHLVRRSYSEPYWSKEGEVAMAYEKVVLYGLTILSRNPVDYSAIDLSLSREIFLRNALVDGNWKAEHTFLKQNLKLRQEIEALEHKLRRRDILLSDAQLFKFYDQRVAKEVVSGRHFSDWWKKTIKNNSELLQFKKQMLFRNDRSDFIASDYPNVWHQNDLSFKLSYKFNPGEDDDGITVNIPLFILNQVKSEGFDWQIPGFRRELISSLIKTLPKHLRQNLFPISNYIDDFLVRVIPGQHTILEALERDLKCIGIQVSHHDWNFKKIPEYLKIKFCVLDDKNIRLKVSKDLCNLKENLTGEIQNLLSKVFMNNFQKKKLYTWNFNTFPTVFQKKHSDFIVKAYPALVDNQDSVEIRLFETQKKQSLVMKSGQLRLILLTLSTLLKKHSVNLPNKFKLGIYFRSYGEVFYIVDDCINCTINKLVEEKGGLVWNALDFQSIINYIRIKSSDTFIFIAEQAESILGCVFSINETLKKDSNFINSLAFLDIKNQLDGLIFNGFLTKHGWRKLPDILRYVQAIKVRIEKLKINPEKDNFYMSKLELLTKEHKKTLNSISSSIDISDNLKKVRWMLEELRVSYFAQHLGTASSVSEKKVRKAIDLYLKFK
ncbi:ATP-dependent RNA helicase hrpA [Candidatus Photodesmus katoptron]|uniref:ATP-dependent RNA helicase HrpA n=1 Tax=Candidatus Photodesmus katoptron Akat1 TaxID=1236703 RepID=S3DZR2_9GAMM|nr:ATP-dependent RNA helicase HrpA [Candidatus Photodesmus katoptron]EPE37451.1 ATP-dependent RNA helicase HrpA [Candidatus Photodesmus katoptron Akat1]KEY90220.1 ATP-dependent RNA helicase hrpA [Candidatus Photodesmus katoptron]